VDFFQCNGENQGCVLDTQRPRTLWNCAGAWRATNEPMASGERSAYWRNSPTQKIPIGTVALALVGRRSRRFGKSDYSVSDCFRRCSGFEIRRSVAAENSRQW